MGVGTFRFVIECSIWEVEPPNLERLLLFFIDLIIVFKKHIKIF